MTDEQRKQLGLTSKIGLPLSLAISLGVVIYQQGMEFFSGLVADSRRHDVALADLTRRCEESRERANRHEVQLTYLTGRIDELFTTATARPDPFTGTQGRELESRIRDLENRR